MAYEQEKNKTDRAVTSPAGMTGIMESVQKKRDVLQARNEQPKGKPYCHLSTSRQRKAANFWSRKATLRALPGHCKRCGAPHTGPQKNCDRCRASQKAYKAFMRRKKLPLLTTEAAELIAALARRIGSLEIAVATLQLTNRDKYKQGYQRGFKRGRNALVRDLEGLRGEFAGHRQHEEISLEELRGLHHAYG